MSKYSDSPEWDDVVPVAQNDGGPNPLAAIAYTEEYSEATSYLRAVMAQDEKADTLFVLKKDLLQELEWLNKISLKHLKNYQIWHHRQTIMSRIPSLPSNELSFLARMFSKDAKNYHVWSYRSWLVRHFSLWETELPYIETLLKEDVRNNSAWNHRWFIVFGRHMDPAKDSIKDGGVIFEIDPEIINREIEYAKEKIGLAPQNQSPWNYLRGILKKRSKSLTEIRDFAEQYANLEKEDEIRSSHALDLLADIFTEENQVERSGKALELLANRFDPIRKNYWNYRRTLLGLTEVSA
ncbi:uncharacterized protein KY384_001988 [Bacidia gigantensis]|uniref:uncharacterized protein n=1 Tax=Bacidia gigantensis TaxID=2732470 RepID=UPI001D05964C|nr:uncharacterized protein KY384_001988 [Bacidia gigantensis]KAG8533205.1 hypothetical protein KY384_001988 [Bacidia gigantensis]